MSNRSHSDNQLQASDRTSGHIVYDLVLARFGRPGLSGYQSTLPLKSADRQATVFLMFGADAAS